MEENKCPSCGNEMFDVFFNDDPRYQNVHYKRCIHCNLIVPYAMEEKEINKAAN